MAKSSSARTMSAASLLTSVPVIPIATPMSARRSAGASLTPSPVIATTARRAAPRLDDAQLLLRVHPRVDGDALDPGLERRVVEPVELGAGEGLAARFQDPDPAGDGDAGERVVAGDHDRRDPGAPARGDGGGRRRAGRIGHRDEPGEAQVRLGLLGDLRDGVQLAVGEGEHAVAVTRRIAGQSPRRQPGGGGQRGRAAGRWPRAPPWRRPRSGPRGGAAWSSGGGRRRT